MLSVWIYSKGFPHTVNDDKHVFGCKLILRTTYVTPYGPLCDMMMRTHVEVEPEDKDEVTHNVDDDEGDEDVSLQFHHKGLAVWNKYGDHSVPDTHHAENHQR